MGSQKEKDGGPIKQRVSFSDQVTSIPGGILEKHYQASSYDFEQLYKQDLVKLDRNARVLQRWARSLLPIWRYIHKEISHHQELLEDEALRKTADLTRVQICLEDLKREAQVEVALEMDEDDLEDENDLDHVNTTKEKKHAHTKQVEQLNHEIKQIKAENAQLEQDITNLAQDNKRLALDTFAMYEYFATSVADVKGMETEQQRLKTIRQKFRDCMGTLQSTRTAVDHEIDVETNQKQSLQAAILKITQVVEARASNKPKLLDKLNKLQVQMLAQSQTAGS